jgi:single-strand DNA-binding protein
MLVLELIGNLGGDAVIKEFSSQKYISFSVAHTESYNDAQGQKHERTTWVSCLKYGESGVLPYLKKGTRVFVRGDVSTKIYDSNGTLQVGISCKVRELQLLGGNNGNKPDQQPETQEAPVSAQPPVNNAPASYPTPSPPAREQQDDLPF